MSAKILVMGVVALVGLSIAAPASAQESSSGSGKKKDDSYGYIFTDDVLKAGDEGAASARITVLKLGRRDRLLRPRVHFVQEMLKSVENM